MTTEQHAPSPEMARAAGVSAAKSIPTFYRMLVRGQLTRGRLLGLCVLAGVSVVLAFPIRDSVGLEPATQLLSRYSIAVLIPLAALILATPMLGNLVEDRLLVYLWLKPVPRWHLAAAAYFAVITVLLPLVVIPIGLTVLVAQASTLVVSAIVAAALGVLAYSAVYLFVGVRFSWGLWLGLLYLVLWENILSTLSDGMARLSIRSYLVSVLQRGTDTVTIPGADRSTWASFAIPIAIAVIGVALTAWTLSNKDID